MKFANGLKFTATGTSAASITVGTAALGCRTLAQVIADSAYDPNGIRVGDLYIPFTVTDGQGNVQTSLYKITSTTQIDLIAILSSSNGGNAVTFGGPLTVYNSDVSWALNYGLTNPHDPGFDIIVLLGQSNMVGQDVPVTALDIVDSRIFAYGCYVNEASTYRKITQAVDPLRHNYSQATFPAVGNGSGLSPGSWLARTWAGMTPSNRKVLLVPCARASTKLFADTREWFPGDGTVGSGLALGATGSTLFDNAIDQATRAVAEAQLMYPNSRVVGIAWHQGEGDADWYGLNLNLNYQSALKTLIQAARARIPTAANSWFVIGGLVGENVADTVGHPGYAAVDTAHRTVAAEVPRCAYTQGLTGYKMGDNLHYTAAGARILGCNMASVIPVAMLSRGVDTTAPVTRSAIVYAADAYTVAWAVSEPVDPNFVPPTSAFALTGHTVASVRVQGNYVYVTFIEAFVSGESARTLVYTASAAGGNGLRDLSGNLMANASQGVTNNAPATPTVTSVTVNPSTANVAGGATQQFTATVAGTNSPSQSVTWSTTAGTIDSSGLFTAPAATGSTQTITVTATSTADNTKSGTSTVTVAATGTPTVTSVTVSPSTANVAGGATQQFSATVAGTNSPAQTVTWSANAGTVNSSGLFTAPAATSSTQTITVTATSTVDGTKSGTATVTVAAVSSGTDLRFTNLTNMTETSAVAPYAYKTNSAIGYNNTNNGGMSVLAAADAFSIKVQIGGGVGNAKPMLSIRNSSAIGPYGTALANFFASTNYSAYSGSISNPTSINGSVVPADSDWMQLSRAAGSTTLKASVSKDGGATWTDICTWPGVSGTVYAQIQSQGNGTFTAPQGTGFA